VGVEVPGEHADVYHGWAIQFRSYVKDPSDPVDDVTLVSCRPDRDTSERGARRNPEGLPAPYSDCRHVRPMAITVARKLKTAATREHTPIAAWARAASGTRPDIPNPTDGAFEAWMTGIEARVDHPDEDTFAVVALG
jgi:hypothetical protein